jgi:hypothetical protein
LKKIKPTRRAKAIVEMAIMGASFFNLLGIGIFFKKVPIPVKKDLKDLEKSIFPLTFVFFSPVIGSLSCL